MAGPNGRIRTEHDRPADSQIETQPAPPSNKLCLGCPRSNDLVVEPPMPAAESKADFTLIREKSLTSLNTSTPSGSSTRALDVSRYGDDGPEPDQFTHYRPSPLRTWYLGTVLFAITVLLCLTVVTVRILPDETKTFAPFLEIGPEGNDTGGKLPSHVARGTPLDGLKASNEIDGIVSSPNGNRPRVAGAHFSLPNAGPDLIPNAIDYAHKGANAVTHKPRDNPDGLVQATHIRPGATANGAFSEGTTAPSVDSAQSTTISLEIHAHHGIQIDVQQADHAAGESTSSPNQNRPRWGIPAWLYAHQGIKVVTKRPRDVSDDLAQATQSYERTTASGALLEGRAIPTPELAQYTSTSEQPGASLPNSRVSSSGNEQHVTDEAKISPFAAVDEKHVKRTKTKGSSSITCTITNYMGDGNGAPIKRTAAAHSDHTSVGKKASATNVVTCVQIDMVWFPYNGGRSTGAVVPNTGSYHSVGRSTVTIKPRDIPLELDQATQQMHAKETSTAALPGPRTAPTIAVAQQTSTVLEQVEFESGTYQHTPRAGVQVVPRPRYQSTTETTHTVEAVKKIKAFGFNTSSIAATALPSPSPSATSSSAANTTQDPDSLQPTEETLDVYFISDSQFFVGLMLPTLLSTLLAIPLRIIDFNAKLYRPFHNLARPDGAAASASLFMPTTGLSSFLGAQDVLGCATAALAALGTVLISISAEAVHIVTHGDECRAGQGSADNCGFTLGVHPAFARVVVAALPVMGALLILAWARLRRYRTAVPARPWSMSFMSRFASDPSIQSLLSQLHRGAGCLEMEDGIRAFDRWIYTIEARRDEPHAGCRVAILEKSTHAEDDDTVPTHRELERPIPRAAAQHARSRALYSFVLTFSGRILMLLALLGVLLLVVVYTQNTDANGFETFMDSETVGVRVFFSSAGVALTVAWMSFFQGVAWTSPYKVARRAAAAAGTPEVLDLSPPTNPFSGLYRVVSGRHPDAYLGAVSLVSILAHMLPSLLVNVPYRVIDTYPFHQSCLWLVVAVVAGMICTVLGSFFVDFPHMPMDPSTVVGAMYYATVDRRDEEKRVAG